MRGAGTVVALLAAAAAAAAAGGARAGGFEYGLQGVEATARSGASVAKAAGPEALYYNVAGLGKVDGISIVIDANFVSTSVDALLDGNAVSTWKKPGGPEYPYTSVHAMTDIYVGGFQMFPAPYAGITFTVPRLPKLALALGFFGPAAVGDWQYPETVEVEEGLSFPAPQRYDVLFEKVLFVWPTIAAAYRLTDQLSIGAGFQCGFMNVEFKMAVNSMLANTPLAYLNDTLATLTAKDNFIPAGIIGMEWRPHDRVEMGWSMRMSDGINAKGQMLAVSNPWSTDPANPPVASNDPSLTWMDQAPYRRPTGALSFNWPTVVYKVGLRYKHPAKNAPLGDGRQLPAWQTELFDLELAFFVEQDHVVEEMKFQMNGYVPYGTREGQATPFKPETQGVVKLRRNWRDTFSVRLGGSVNLLKGHLTLSGGAFYESPTVENEDTRLDYLANERWGLSCGVQGRHWDIKAGKRKLGIEVSLAYVHFFYPSFSVKEGKIEHVSFLADETTPINNGSYKFSMDVLTAGISILLP